MPKRSGSSTTGARPVAGTPVAGAVSGASAGVDGVDEHGAFAFATCDVCGWRGPGRRSRDRARTELEHHLAPDGIHPAAGGEASR